VQRRRRARSPPNVQTLCESISRPARRGRHESLFARPAAPVGLLLFGPAGVAEPGGRLFTTTTTTTIVETLVSWPLSLPSGAPLEWVLLSAAIVTLPLSLSLVPPLPPPLSSSCSCQLTSAPFLIDVCAGGSRCRCCRRRRIQLVVLWRVGRRRRPSCALAAKPNVVP
jgi:hypothetical protein